LIADKANILELPVRKAISYVFDDFRLDVERQELQKNGQPVPLTHKAYQVLLVLVQNSEQTVDKEYIYEQLWGDSFVEDANLTQHIYVLRKTLGHMPSGDSYIETVARAGYRFRAKVRPVYPTLVPEASFKPREATEAALKREPIPFIPRPLKPAEAKHSETVDAAVPSETGQGTPADSRRGSRRGYRPGVTVALIGLSIAIVALAVYFRPQTQVSPVAGARSLAVLPFKAIGNDGNNDKLGLGMADSIITRLSKLQQIPVRPTSSVVRYTDAPASNSIVAGQEMGVDTVLEGTVQHEGDRVRVSVQLIDVSNGSSLWAENFDESFTNIFSVQDSISHKVVRALAFNLTRQQEQLLSQDATTNVEALQAYQMGVYLHSTRSKQNMLRAVDYFEEAVRHDPNYAKAYAMEADVYNMLRYYRYADPNETREKATVLANKALELNNEIPEPYIALANLQAAGSEGTAAAQKLLEKAIELSPYNSTARLRYAWVIAGNDLDSASEQMRLSQEYDPLSGLTNGAYCNILTFQRRFKDAIRFCERSVELANDSPTTRILLADAYFLDGRLADAIAQINQRINETEGTEKLMAEGSLGFYLAKSGRMQEAASIFAKLKSALEEHPQIVNDLVLIAYAIGRIDEGLRYFERSYRESRLSKLMFDLSPIWQDVRADKRVYGVMDRLKTQS
jgi:TolB-like protein/DNA-binding winged helix-turn-helix (wHTH) protein/Flp pilus assembly protein TadD